MHKMIPVAVKRHWKNLFGIGLSAFLLWAGLWQSEIVDICIYEHGNFDWPFYILPSLNVWVARDLFMAVIVFAYVLLFASLWWWNT